jgi:phage terminase large subunit-like protein
MTHADKAIQYAEQITNGSIPACKWIKLACQRFLNDLDRQDWLFTFDTAKANRVCEFIECLPHVKGKWAARRETLILQPWQCFIECNLFGWVNRESGFRRYQEAYICVPRKNGKSPLAAGIALYMTGCDGEAGAEVYCGATSERQAWEVFRPARLMVQKVADLRKVLGFKVNAKSLVIEKSGSRFEPVIGKPGDGASVSCGIGDEFHEADTADLYDTFKTGMVGRDQPLLLIITTAGFDIASPCYALQVDAQQVLDGTNVNEQLFSVIYTIDEDVDWTSELALRMANPNFGVSVNADKLLHDQQQAASNAAKANVFKTKHLCVWCSANSAFFNMPAWNKCGDPALNETDFKDDPCYIGVDLASQIDLSAVVKVYVRRIEGKLNFYVFPRHYLPEDRIELPENQHYQKWNAAGQLIATDGSSLDYALVRADLVMDCETCKVQEVCFDKAYASQLMQEVNLLTGVTLCEVPQNTRELSLPMKVLDAAIQDGRIHHSACPVLTWCMNNVVAHPDANENVFPRKQKPEYKIDGAVALINAMKRAITCDAMPKMTAFQPFFI